MSGLITRFFFVCGALFLLVVGAAFGGGTYQRTRDGKTMVWNDRAKPGDKASWSGSRDREGYATGFGTLTWYTAEHRNDAGSTRLVVDVRYWGNMVRGKFDGPVNAHSKGKTDYAVFADGTRTTRWTVGTAPSRVGAQRRLRSLKEKREIAENNQHPASKPFASRASNPERTRERSPQPPSPDTPAEGPVPAERSEISGQKSEVGVQMSEDRSQSSVPAATPSVREEIGKQKPEVGPEKSEILEGTPATKEAVAGVGPGKVGSKRHLTKRSRAKADAALRELVVPPASLRADTVNAPSTNAQSEAASLGSIAARLTREEVVDSADAEARRRGYDLAEYLRGEPEYQAADEIWSISYKELVDDKTAETAKTFSVTIDDKTKGIVFVPGK